MFELHQLEVLLAFEKYKTLSEAAQQLNLTQPALSRTLKKLEDELGVSLFTRQKNKIELNETGALAAELAKSLVADAEELEAKIKSFALKKCTVSIGSCAPAPIWELLPTVSASVSNTRIITEMADDNKLTDGLMNDDYQIVITTVPIENEKVFCREYQRESLMLSVVPKHRFADRESVTFDDIDGENMLLLNDIGFWHYVHETKMPHSKFLIQHDSFNFNELVNASVLPCFSSDLALKYYGNINGRVNIPITDKEASVIYYFSCLKKNKQKFNNIIRGI